MIARQPGSRWLLALVVVSCMGCAHKAIARERLEREGCSVTSLEREGKGYAFEASCVSQVCEGTMEVRGTRMRNTVDTSKSCRLAPNFRQ